VSLSSGALSAFLFVTAAGNLFFNSLIAEIDIFYSMITYAGLICMFHMQQRKKYFLLFLVVYFLGAVGTLTKGMPSIIFTGLSILVFFIVNKEFKKLFSWAHFLGIILYFIIVGGYFAAYNSQGDALQYLLSLTLESGQRLSGDTFGDYLKHMVLYPLDTLMNLLPASILLIFTIRRSFLKVIRENPFMKFALLMLIVHFPVYWLPPGGRQRYIIMLYPFIVQILTYFYLHFFMEEKGKSRIVCIIITTSLAIATAACLVPLFVRQMDFIPSLALICISLFILMAVTTVFQIRKPRHSILFLILAMIMIRVLFDLTVLPVRAKDGGAQSNKKAALELARLTAGKPVTWKGKGMKSCRSGRRLFLVNSILPKSPCSGNTLPGVRKEPWQ
jgi:4-amino-4-deoxy-L-arabinose transferase-like glycosyltransferase